jgi:hypothetical protein
MAKHPRSTAQNLFDELTPLQAKILAAYFALRATSNAEAIGSVEIRQWLRSQDPDMELPSESLVRTILARAELRRRGDGRPTTDSRTEPEVSPFLPVRREPPLLNRESRRRLAR